eukprot:3973996-Prymnesium_polylepis.1
MRARGRQLARPRRSSAYPQETHSNERRPQSLHAHPGTGAAATSGPASTHRAARTARILHVAPHRHLDDSHQGRGRTSPRTIASRLRELPYSTAVLPTRHTRTARQTAGSPKPPRVQKGATPE